MGTDARFVDVRGVRVPAIGLGTWMLTGRECRRAVETALALGYRHIDTARIYDNEPDVGKGLAASRVPREEVFLTTKVWRDELHARDVERAAERSLKLLTTPYVDLLLVHWPNPAIPLEETLGAFVRLEERGLVRHVGVSNFPPALLRRAAALAPILCNQVEMHPYLGQRELHALAERLDLLLTAYSPLARGRVERDPAVAEVARRLGRTPAQVVLRWLVGKGRVAAIPKASSPEHLAANLKIFDFELGPDDAAAIDALDRGRRIVDPAFAPDWNEAG